MTDPHASENPTAGTDFAAQPPVYIPPAAPGAGAQPPAYGYPAAPGPYPAPPVYGYLPPSGRKYWGLLFLFYVPYVGALVTIIVSLIQCSSAKRSPVPIVRENARWAANWTLSYCLYQVVLIGALIAIAASTSTGGRAPSVLMALPGVLVFVVGIYCLVTIIRGTVLGDRVVHRPALAIPFFRS